VSNTNVDIELVCTVRYWNNLHSGTLIIKRLNKSPKDHVSHRPKTGLTKSAKIIYV